MGIFKIDYTSGLWLPTNMHEFSDEVISSYITDAHPSNYYETVVKAQMDGTAKGGIAVAIQSELKIPVKYIGVGETTQDLQKFNPAEFVDALFETGGDGEDESEGTDADAR